MKTQDIPLFSSSLGHSNSHFRRKITIIPPEFPFFKIVRCTTIVTHLWLISRSRALPSLPPPSLPPSFFCFRFRQQDVRCWWTTVYNVIVQQRTRIHAAKEYFTRGWQGFHSGKRKKKKRKEKEKREKKNRDKPHILAYIQQDIYKRGHVYWIGKWSGWNIGGTFKNPSRFVEGFIREIFDGTLSNFIYSILDPLQPPSPSHPPPSWLAFPPRDHRARSSDLITFNPTASHWSFSDSNTLEI